MSSATPPRTGSTFANLVQLRGGEGFADLTLFAQHETLDRAGAISNNATGSPSDPSAFGTLPHPLLRQLASAELLAGVAVTVPGAWTKNGGAPASTVSAPGGASITIDAINPGAAEDSAKLVTPTKQHLLELQAAAMHPELMFILGANCLVVDLDDSTISDQDLMKRYGGTMLLVDVVSDVVSNIVQQLKYRLRVPRPNELIQSIQPLIRQPKHSSYPSGHAAISYALANTLQEVLGSGSATGLNTLADHITVGRVEGGVHTPLDSKVGKELGEKLGSAMKAISDMQKYPVWCGIMERAKTEFTKVT